MLVVEHDALKRVLDVYISYVNVEKQGENCGLYSIQLLVS